MGFQSLGRYKVAIPSDKTSHNDKEKGSKMPDDKQI